MQIEYEHLREKYRGAETALVESARERQAAAIKIDRLERQLSKVEFDLDLTKSQLLSMTMLAQPQP